MADVMRIYPESKSGLINWIEQNFHEIDEFVVQFTLKDRTTMFVYDANSVISALGMLELAKGSVHQLAVDEEFTPKKRSD